MQHLTHLTMHTYYALHTLFPSHILVVSLYVPRVYVTRGPPTMRMLRWDTGGFYLIECLGEICGKNEGWF